MRKVYCRHLNIMHKSWVWKSFIRFLFNISMKISKIIFFHHRKIQPMRFVSAKTFPRCLSSQCLLLKSNKLFLFNSHTNLSYRLGASVFHTFSAEWVLCMINKFPFSLASPKCLFLPWRWKHILGVNKNVGLRTPAHTDRKVSPIFNNCQLIKSP